MEIVEQLADVFAKAGGFGLAAVFAWMYWQKSKAYDALQNEFRGAVLETTKTLVASTTEANILNNQVVQGLNRVSEDLRRNNNTN